jgi:glyoxylase-like metal-dependent hydrolase (beta-lactamase superfamily II)
MVPNPIRINLGVTNSYALPINEGYLFIDLSYKRQYNHFLKQLRKKPIPLEDISHVFLTHHHAGHAGFLQQLVEETDTKIILHENSLQWLKHGYSFENMKPVNTRIKVLYTLFAAFNRGVYDYDPLDCEESRLIEVDEKENKSILSELGLQGKIIQTPGHTPDGLSIVFDDGKVFCGDNAMNAFYFNLLGIQKRPIYYYNIDLIFESWKKYLDEGAKKIFPAHGRPFKSEILKKKLEKFGYI